MQGRIDPGKTESDLLESALNNLLLDEFETPRRIPSMIENPNYPCVSEVSNKPYKIQPNTLSDISPMFEKGSFGSIYKAKWNKQSVAIKRIKHVSAPLTWCRHENAIMQALSRVESPYVVKYHGYVECKSSFLIVMEFVSYHSLAYFIDNQIKPLDWNIRYNFVKTILQGIAYIHSSGVVHGDLKDANILITSHWKTKICDFGFSSFGTRTSCVTGTDGWLAPETMLDGTVSESSDIYSLAVLIWQIAAWKLPTLYNDEVKNLLLEVITGKREKIPNDCPKKIAHLVRWCWETKESNRPTAQQCIEEIATDIDTISNRLASH